MIPTPPQAFPFIVGCGRSGTTLLRSMLDSHPNMAIPPETYFTLRLAANRRRYEGRGRFATGLFLDDLCRTGGYRRMGMASDALRERIAADPPETYAGAIRSVYREYASSHGKTRYGDKTPIYILHLPLLGSLFPEAKFVHIIRDGRDVTRSFMDGGWTNRIEDGALYWKLQVRRGRRAGAGLGPERYREVRYEDLIDDPAAVLSSVCSFLNLEYDPQMLRYQETARRWASTSRDPNRHRNLLREPTKGLRDWRTQMPPEELAVVEHLIGDLLSELGYELRGGNARSFAIDARRRWLGWQTRRVLRRGRRSLPGAPRAHKRPAMSGRQGN